MNFCYPKGKSRAVIFSYDDGRTADRRLVEIFNRYGIRGSFHLNSGKLGEPGYVTSEEIVQLYQGHEISCHGVKHENLPLLTKEQCVVELWLDRRDLEQYTKTPVTGLSYAYGTYDAQVLEVVKALGIEYARTTKATMDFLPPEDFLLWHPTCHHRIAFEDAEMVRQFLTASTIRRLPLFYIWGHSYELENRQEWEKMEDLCSRLSGHSDIWYTTSLEYCRYVRSARELVFTCDGSRVYNPSCQEIWLKEEEACVCIPSGYSGSVYPD